MKKTFTLLCGKNSFETLCNFFSESADICRWYDKILAYFLGHGVL